MLRRMLTALVGQTDLTSLPSSGARADEDLSEARELIASGDFKGAEDRLRRIVRANGRDAEAHRLLGSALGADGRADEAREILEQALTLDPDNPAGLVLLGNAYRLSGRLDAAERHYRRALEIDPTIPAARFGAACVAERVGRIEAAKNGYSVLLEPPAFVPAFQALIRLLLRCGQEEEAKRVCAAVLAREPEHGLVHAALGFLLLNRELNADAALEHFERALQAGYSDGELLRNRHIARGIALQYSGELQAAIGSYDAALQMRADDPLARFHRALALLLSGDFEHGWPDYEARLASEDKNPPPRDLPRWRGEALPKTTLLVYGEQGIGDEIMFASCLPDLMRACPSVVLTCAPKLNALFARSFPEIAVVSSDSVRVPGAAGSLARASVMSAIGSLPLHLRQTLAHFPQHNGYLRADPDLITQYRQRLHELGPGPRVGLSWRGGTARSRQSMRSLGQDHVAEILSVQGIQFINLQYDSTGDDPSIAPAVSSGRLLHWPQTLGDYDHTAALVSCLDLVVSVCTAVIHLAGALARPVWVMTPFSPEWRYGIAGQKMPWYPSAELIRQRSRGDWEPVITAVCSRLRALSTDSNFTGTER